MMQYSAKEISKLVNGKVEGDPKTEVSNFSKIDEGQPGTLTFLANPKYEKYLYTTEASIILVNEDLEPEHPVDKTLIRVKDAYSALAQLMDVYQKQKKQRKGIAKNANISSSAQIGKNAYIGNTVVIEDQASIGDDVQIHPQVYIGENVHIGNGTILYPGVKIYDDCQIGDNCTIHSGVIIGGDGFGFAPNTENNYAKVPQIGNVIIEDHVEIGSNTTIDRATIGSTIIRKGVKLDNLIQIAHNVEVGENTVIVSQAGIAGSTKIGKNCIIAGQVGIIGHLNIGDNVKIAAQSGVTKDIEDNQVVQGSAAFDFAQYQKVYVVFRKLPELRKQVIDLAKEIKEIKTKI